MLMFRSSVNPEYVINPQAQSLRCRLADLELQLAESRRNEIQAREEKDLARLREALTPTRSRSPSVGGRSSTASPVNSGFILGNH